jgi:putative flippase GtrA
LNEKTLTAVQFAKFSLIGVLNTGIHYLVFLLLFFSLGMNYILASTIGYCAGLVNSFILNKKWTFQADGHGSYQELFKFLLVNAAALLLNLALLRILVAQMGTAPAIAQLVAMCFSLSGNFLGNRFWTFKKGHD